MLVITTAYHKLEDTANGSKKVSFHIRNILNFVIIIEFGTDIKTRPWATMKRVRTEWIALRKFPAFCSSKEKNINKDRWLAFHCIFPWTTWIQEVLSYGYWSKLIFLNVLWDGIENLVFMFLGFWKNPESILKTTNTFSKKMMYPVNSTLGNLFYWREKPRNNYVVFRLECHGTKWVSIQIKKSHKRLFLVIGT